MSALQASHAAALVRRVRRYDGRACSIETEAMPDAPTQCLPPVDPESLARTLNALFMGFQVIGFDWTYLYVNPAAAGHGRSSPEALIGRTMFEAYPEIGQQEPLMTFCAAR